MGQSHLPEYLEPYVPFKSGSWLYLFGTLSIQLRRNENSNTLDWELIL